MKKSAYIILLLILNYPLFSQSPGVRIGASWAVGKAQFAPYEGFNQMPKLSYNLGIVAAKQFNKNIGLETGMLFSQKGASVFGKTQSEPDLFGNTRYYNYRDDYYLFCAEVPLLLKLSIGFNDFHLKGFAGPSANLNLSAFQDRIYDDPNYNSRNGFSKNRYDMQTIEFSAIYGLGFEFETGSGNIFFIDLRFNSGITPTFRIENKFTYNDSFLLSMGCLFK